MVDTEAPTSVDANKDDVSSSTSSNVKTISTNRNTKKGKKRKLSKQSREDLYIAEHKDRYNKLHHACSKLLHREGKIVKSFMCQKIGKEIKTTEEKESNIKDNEEAESDTIAKLLAKTQKRRVKLELKLEKTKKFDLASIVDVGLKRLGVLNLNSSEDDNDKNPSSKSSNSQADDPFYVDLIESMLQQKRLSSAMDQLNDKVTDFRQWSMRREQMLMGNKNPAYADDNRSNKKRKKHMQSDETNETLVFASGSRNSRNMGGHEGTSGLFIGSLSGIPVEGEEFDEGNEEQDHDGYDDILAQPKKKNRPGQRQRKAKAMAIEAKRAGRTWDSSNNWREKKKGNVRRDESRGKDGSRSKSKSDRDNGRHYDNADSIKPRKAEQIAQMGKSWKEDGNAHPSWAAAAAQKSQGIQTFTGKKITFD